MNPRILMVVGAVVVVLIIASVGAYFFVFKKGEPQIDPAQLEAMKDTDGDTYKDVDERAQGTDPNDPSRFPGSHKKVLIARKDIPANQLIRDDDLDVKEVAAKGQSPDAAVLEANKDRIVGHISTVEIRNGEFLVDAMVYGGRPQLSYLVPKYKRAISLRYDPTAAVSGLVQLGDVVDVIGNFAVRRREGGELPFTRIIVQNARVIALGTEFLPRPPSDTSTPAPPTGLTVSVYPHEAERLIWAENYLGSRLVLALRSPANDVLARTTGVMDEGVFGQTILNDARLVEVYYGSQGAGVARFEPLHGRRQEMGRISGSVITWSGN